MKQWRLARGLYLLALLQLVGGPTVLCGIFLLVKLTASHPVNTTVASGFCTACESRDLAAVVDDLLPLAHAGDGKSKSPSPSKTKIGVGKLLLAGDTAPVPFLFAMNALAPPKMKGRMIAIQGHAPPVPPPRVA
jgi:hypothetical protein